VSGRATGYWGVGHFEDEIGHTELQGMAAARVIGQTTVGLMIGDLISGNTYGRLLEPWHVATRRLPRLAKLPVLLEPREGAPLAPDPLPGPMPPAALRSDVGLDKEARPAAVQSNSRDWLEPPSRMVPMQPSPLVAGEAAEGQEQRGCGRTDEIREPTGSVVPPSVATNESNMQPLSELLELASQADGVTRISYRDQIAAFGREAIEPMALWLADPRLGAFAARTLERIAGAVNAVEVYDALRRGLTFVSSEAVRNDVQAILRKLEPEVTRSRTLEWMRTQPRSPTGAEWTRSDADRLIAKMEGLDTRRRQRGLEPLGGGERSSTMALQFADFWLEPYLNHCWVSGCGGSIDSEVNARCGACRMFICGRCGACMCRG
jgi:hypothetical protein